MANKYSKRKKRKFKKVEFKLTSKQMKSLMNYCAARKTTPIKLIKKRIRDYTENYSEKVPQKYYLTSNQLTMFDDEAENSEQTLDMFE
jgi:hypothetical protein